LASLGSTTCTISVCDSEGPLLDKRSVMTCR
jgi:hypothetical protein